MRPQPHGDLVSQPDPAAAHPRPAEGAAAVRLLVCSFEVEDGGADGPGACARLQACGWRHDRIEAAYAVLPAQGEAALAAVRAALRATRASGVLLLAPAPAGTQPGGEPAGFVVEMRARNRAEGAAAAADRRSRRISPTGPGSARATAPIADLARALAAQGLPVRARSDAAPGAVNFVLYRLLTEVAAEAGGPTVGALQLPASGRTAPEALDRGLCAAALAFADTLAPAVLALEPA